jgi:hypothetical protein
VTHTTIFLLRLSHPRVWKAMKAKGALNETIRKAVEPKPGNNPCGTATMLEMSNATNPNHKSPVVPFAHAGVGSPDATKRPASLTPTRKGSHFLCQELTVRQDSGPA